MSPLCRTEHPGMLCGALLARLPPHPTTAAGSSTFRCFLWGLHGPLSTVLWQNGPTGHHLRPALCQHCWLVLPASAPWLLYVRARTHGDPPPPPTPWLPPAPFGGSGCPGRVAAPFSFAKEPRGGPQHAETGEIGAMAWPERHCGPIVPTPLPSWRLSRQRGDAGFWAWACRGGRGRAGSQPFPSPRNLPGRLPWALFFSGLKNLSTIELLDCFV